MYAPHVKKLYDYFLVRLESEVQQINAERQLNNAEPIVLTSEKRVETAQALVNFVHDTEAFEAEISNILTEKLLEGEDHDEN